MNLYIQSISDSRLLQLDTPVDFTVNFTYELNNSSKPDALLNNYSKTVKIPGTSNNNKAFKDLYNIDMNQSNANISNYKIQYLIINNGIIINNGYMVIDSISVTNNEPTYNCTLYGNFGEVFSILNTTDDNTKSTLADLYYGFNVPWDMKSTIDLDYTPSYSNLNKMSEEQEATKYLFNYNTWFVKNAYDRLADYGTSNYNSTSTDVNNAFVPIFCYAGLHENFDNNKVLFNNNDYNAGNRYLTLPTTIIEDGQVTHSTTYSNGWSVLEYDRDVNDIEMRDMRSHFIPLGIKTGIIYNAIKDKLKSKGYNLNDTLLNPLQKEIINNSILSLGTLNWEEIAGAKQNIQKRIPATTINTDFMPDYDEFGDFPLTDVNFLQRPEFKTKTVFTPSTVDISKFNGNLYSEFSLQVNHQVISPTPVTVGGLNKNTNTRQNELFNFEQDTFNNIVTPKDYLNEQDDSNWNVEKTRPNRDIRKNNSPMFYRDMYDLLESYGPSALRINMNLKGQRAWYQGTFVKQLCYDNNGKLIGISTDIIGSAPGTNRSLCIFPRQLRLNNNSIPSNLSEDAKLQESVADIFTKTFYSDELKKEVNYEFVCNKIIAQVAHSDCLTTDEQYVYLHTHKCTTNGVPVNSISDIRKTNNLLKYDYFKDVSYNNVFSLLFNQQVESETWEESLDGKYAKNNAKDDILPFKTQYYKVELPGGAVNEPQSSDYYGDRYYAQRAQDRDYQWATVTNKAYIRNASFYNSATVSFDTPILLEGYSITDIAKIDISYCNFSVPLYFYKDFSDIFGWDYYYIDTYGTYKSQKSTNIQYIGNRVYGHPIFDYTRNNTIFTVRKATPSYRSLGAYLENDATLLLMPRFPAPTDDYWLESKSQNGYGQTDYTDPDTGLIASMGSGNYTYMENHDYYTTKDNETIFPKHLCELKYRHTNCYGFTGNMSITFDIVDPFTGLSIPVYNNTFGSNYLNMIYGRIYGTKSDQHEATALVNILKLTPAGFNNSSESASTLPAIQQIRLGTGNYDESKNVITGRTTSCISSVTFSSSKVPKEHYVTKYDLLGDTMSPFEFLKSMITALNIKYDLIGDNLYLMSVDKYFRGILTPSIVDKHIDKSNYSIKPYWCDYSEYIYGLNMSEDNYAYKLFKKYYNTDPNIYKFNTKNYISKDIYDFSDSIQFKQTITYKYKGELLTNFSEADVKLNNYKNDYVRYIIPQSIKVYLGDLNNNINSIEYTGTKNRLPGVLYTSDTAYRPSFIDSNDEYINDSKNSILFFNGFETVKTSGDARTDLMNQWIISDSLEYMYDMNGQACHLALDPNLIHVIERGTDPIYSSYDTDTSKFYAYKISQIPLFSNYSNKGIKFSFADKTTLESENKEYPSLFDTFHKSHNYTLLNGTNRKITTKMRLDMLGNFKTDVDGVPNGLLYQYYQIGAKKYILNKVTDYNYMNDKYYECEFIEITPLEIVPEMDIL